MRSGVCRRRCPRRRKKIERRRHASSIRGGHTLEFLPNPTTLTGAGLRGASGAHDPGAYKTRSGAVPDRSRGSGYTAPTYNCRDPAGSPRQRLTWLCILPFPDSLLEVSLQPAAHVTTEKKSLRAYMIKRRAALISAQGEALAAAIAAHGLGFLAPANRGIVSAFSSMRDELDTQPMMQRLAWDGFQVALPVMQGKGRPLQFRAWSPGDAMNEGTWGIREPKDDKPLLVPDVFLVPLLAFDRQGWRLGYGGGFYDRTLREARRGRSIVAVGFALDEQEVDAVPHLDYDERLDWVLTPSGPRRC